MLNDKGNVWKDDVMIITKSISRVKSAIINPLYAMDNQVKIRITE